MRPNMQAVLVCVMMMALASYGQMFNCTIGSNPLTAHCGDALYSIYNLKTANTP